MKTKKRKKRSIIKQTKIDLKNLLIIIVVLGRRRRSNILNEMSDCTIDELILLLGLNHTRPLRAQFAHSLEYVDFALLTFI